MALSAHRDLARGVHVTLKWSDGALFPRAEAWYGRASRPFPLLQAIVRDFRHALDTVRVWFIPYDTPYFLLADSECGARGAGPDW